MASTSEDLKLRILNFTNTAARDTLTELISVWDEMGASEERRKQVASTICDAFTLTLCNAVKEETSHREYMKENNIKLLNAIQSICSTLKYELPMDAHGSLQQKHDVLTQQFETLQKRKEDIIAELFGLYEELLKLWSELGIQCPADFEKWNDEDLSESRVMQYRHEISIASQEKINRITEIKNLTVDVIELWEELCMPADDTEFDKAILEGNLSPCKSNILELQKKKADLVEEKEFREETITEYAKKITELWYVLEVSDTEQHQFFIQHSGLGPSVLDACKSELKRLKELRRASLGRIIFNRKEDLCKLWDDIHFDENSREIYCPAYFSTEVSEEILDEIELGIKNMAQTTESLRPIISLVQRREALQKERMELSDPNRLLTKSGDQAGKLLREEKFRRMVEKELPKIESTLKEMLSTYEKVEGYPFAFNGRRYLEVMEEEEILAQKKKEAEKSRRENRTPLHTPVKAPLPAPATIRTPKRTKENTAQTPSKRVALGSTRKMTPLSPMNH